MLLAEALAERAQAQERLNSLHERLLTVARVQEGDTPDEDPQELLRELDGARRLTMGKHDEPPRHRLGHSDTEFAFHHERTSQISLPTP